MGNAQHFGYRQSCSWNSCRHAFSPSCQSGWITGTSGKPAPAARWPRTMVAIFCANQPRNTSVVCRPLILNAGTTRRPTLGSRIGMGVKSCDNHMISEQWRIGKRKSALCPCGSSARRNCARRKLHVNPTSLLMPLLRIGHQRICPSLAQGIQHFLRCQEVRGIRSVRWSTHRRQSLSGLAPIF
jgi:hypothetical protein